MKRPVSVLAMRLLWAFAALLLCQSVMAARVLTIDRINFTYKRISDDGYILYSCKECDQEIFAGTFDHPNISVLQLHAQVENRVEGFTEEDHGPNVFYRDAKKLTGRCKHCGTGERPAQMVSHRCANLAQDDSTTASSITSGTTPSWVDDEDTLSTNTTANWVASLPTSSYTDGSEDTPSIVSTSPSQSEISSPFRPSSSSYPHTRAHSTATSSSFLTIDSLSLAPGVAPADAVLDEVKITFPVQSLPGGDIVILSFQREWNGSQHIWRCTEEKKAMTGPYITQYCDGTLGSACVDETQNTYHFGFKNPPESSYGQSGEGIILGTDGLRPTFPGTYTLAGIKHQCKNDTEKQKHPHKFKGKKNYINNPPRFPTGTPYTSCIQSQLYTAHQTQLHTPQGIFDILRKGCHYLQEPLGCCAVQTSQGVWVFISLSPTQKHDDLTDQANNQRKFACWNSMNYTVTTPPFGSQKAASCFYNRSLNGVAVDDHPYLCYIGHQDWDEAKHQLTGTIFIVSSIHARETAVPTLSGHQDVYGVTPLSDKRIMAFPCNSRRPEIGIYNPDSRSWQFETLEVPTGISIPPEQYQFVMTTHR
ncbi:hypothetical protein ACWJJH_17285 [Endozoicomonadaceae bacterium StTr2]